MAKTYNELLSILKTQRERTDLPQPLQDAIVDMLSDIVGYDGDDMMSPNGINDYLYDCDTSDDLTEVAAAKYVMTLV